MKYCSKCKKNFDSDDNFCEVCGSKLKEELKKKGLKDKKNHSHGFWIFWAIVILVAVFFVAVPLPHTVYQPYTEQEPYTDYETYTDSVPYNDQQCNNVDYSFMKTKQESIGLDGGSCTSGGVGYNSATGQCTIAINIYIKNLDSTGGNFYSLCSYSNGQKFRTSDRYIESGATEYVQCFNTYSAGQTVYLSSTQIVPPQKQSCQTITNYRQETKQRQVTKYRDVTKPGVVTQYNTLLQQLF